MAKISEAKRTQENVLANSQDSSNRKQYKAIKVNLKTCDFAKVQSMQVAIAMEEIPDLTMEEYLNNLYECNARRMSFKQAFSALGMIDKNKPLKQLNDKELFSALANWAINELPKMHSMILRVTHGATYQTILVKSLKNLRVGRLVKVTGPGGVAYDWPETTRYDSLNLSTITASVHRANEINEEKGVDMNALERKQQVQEQIDEVFKQEPQESPNREEEVSIEAASTSGMPWSTPKITLRQTEPNCWQVILNKEEQELIDEFLET